VGELVKHSQDIDLQCFECENDEACSFVSDKSNKQWIWMAMHRGSRMIVGLFIGERGKEGAQRLWDAVPEAIREKAVFHTGDARAGLQKGLSSI
jgi:IS1 family transposase